jgi:hypothetical protein
VIDPAGKGKQYSHDSFGNLVPARLPHAEFFGMPQS